MLTSFITHNLFSYNSIIRFSPVSLRRLALKRKRLDNPVHKKAA